MEPKLRTNETEAKTTETEPKPIEFPTLEKAKDKILTPRDEAYQEAHSAPLTKPRRLRTAFGPQEVLMIGSKHAYDMESPMLKATLDHVRDYLTRVPKEKQLVMVEGFHTKNPSAQPTLEESVRIGGEAQATVFLAQEADTEVISPEPNDKSVTEHCIAEGFTREEIALHFALRSVPGVVRRDKPLDQAALKGCLEAGLIERQRATEDQEGAEAEAVTLINRQAEKSLGRAFLAEDQSASITMEDAMTLLRPDPEGAITNRIGIACNKARDEYILDTIDAAIKEGKSPMVVYGASHLVCIRPALEYLYAD